MAGEVHESRLLTDAIITQLTAAGLIVGDADAPAGASAGQVGTSGYVVVYPLIGGSADGSIAKPDADAAVPVQLTSVGASRQQCEWVADKVRTTVLAAAPTVANRVVQSVRTDMIGGSLRDDDADPPIFYSPDRYRYYTTPA